MFELALKELTRRKRLYLLSIATMSAVVSLIVVLNALGAAYLDAARLPFDDVQGTIVVQKNGNVPEDISGVLLSCSMAPIDSGFVSAVADYEGVKSVSSALSLWVFDTAGFKRVLGVNWHDDFGAKLASKVISGAVPASDHEVLVEKTYADQNNLGVGQEIIVDDRTLEISGILLTAGNEIVGADVYENLAAAQSMAFESRNLQSVEEFAPDDVNIVFLNAAQPSISAVAQRLKSDLVNAQAVGGQTPLGQTIGDYNIYTPESFESQIASAFKLSDRLLAVISVVIVIGAALIVARSILRGITERRREFGIMKSVGFTKRDIRTAILTTTALQTLAGFVIGLAIAGVAIGILSRTTVTVSIPWELTAYPHFLLANPEAANVAQVHQLPIVMQPVYMLVSLLTVGGIGLLSALVGTHAVNRLKPMQVMRYE